MAISASKAIKRECSGLIKCLSSKRFMLIKTIVQYIKVAIQFKCDTTFYISFEIFQQKKKISFPLLKNPPF